MVIKVAITDEGCSFEVPGKGSVGVAVMAIKALQIGQPIPAEVVDVTQPQKRLEHKAEVSEDEAEMEPEEVQEAKKPGPKPVAKAKSKGKRKPVTVYSREEQEKTATLLIKSGQSFYLKDVCPYQNEKSRKSFIQWLHDNFKVEVMPKTAGKAINLYNPYCVVPYTTERAGVKKYAPMPWEFDNEAVKGGAFRSSKPQATVQESAAEDAHTSSVA